MPFQLTYHSIASPGITEKDIKEIMDISTKNNAELGITGCLLFHKNFFLQILEGEEDKVLDVYDKIKYDDRNDQVTLLSTDHSDFRIFKEWAMAYHHIPNKEDLSAEEQKVRQDLIELSDSSKKPNFTLKVFWYNVKQLLSSEGYYQNQININPID